MGRPCTVRMLVSLASSLRLTRCRLRFRYVTSFTCPTLRALCKQAKTNDIKLAFDPKAEGFAVLPSTRKPSSQIMVSDELFVHLLSTSASLSLIDKRQVQIKYKVSNLELQAAPASSQIPLGLQSSSIPCDHGRRTRSSGGQSFTHFRFRVSAMATFVCRVDALSRIRKLTSFTLRYSRVLTHNIAGARLSLASLSLSYI